MPKVDITIWIEFLIRLLKKILGRKVKFALVVSKIIDSISIKNNSKRQGSVVVKARMGENVDMHVETIKKQ